MVKRAFAIKHKINNAIRWYGSEFEVLRKDTNDYGEPIEESKSIFKFNGIYHESQQSFLDLLNIEAAQVKIKTNKGILTMSDVYSETIEQGDYIMFNGSQFNITAVEPVMVSDVQIATEISLEEVIDCEN